MRLFVDNTPFHEGVSGDRTVKLPHGLQESGLRNSLQTRSHLHGMIKDTWYTRVEMSDFGDIVLFKGSFCYTMGLWLRG